MHRSIVALSSITAVALAASLSVTPAFAADEAVSGTVTYLGQPAVGVEVGWYDPATGAAGETVSAADGTYALTVGSGHPFFLYAGINHSGTKWKRVAADYVGVFSGATGQDTLFQTLTPFPADVAGKTGATIALEQSGTIAGVTPGLASVSVANGAGNTIVGAKTGADGSYSFARLIPGRYRVTGWQTKAAGGRQAVSTVTVAAGATTPATFRFPPAQVVPTGRIAGTLTSNGKPVKGAQVFSVTGNLVGGSDTTDAKGHYSLNHLANGTYTVWFGVQPGYGKKNAYVPERDRVSVKNGKATHASRALERGATIVGSVIPRTKDYIRITVLDSKGNVLIGGSLVVKKVGKAVPFRLNGVPAGTNRVVISDGAHYSSFTQTFSGGTVSIGKRIASSPTITLRGKLAGKYAEVLYTLGTESNGSDEVDYPARSYTVAKNGRYVLKGIIPGAASLEITASNREGRVIHFTATRSETKNLNAGIAFLPATGTVTLNGYAVPKAYVSATKKGSDRLLGGFAVKAGTITGSISPRTVHLDVSTDEDQMGFVEDSPFWVSLPGTVSPAHGKFALGSLALTLHR
jgi:Polysaccharide lyase family 4, domain II